MLEPARTLYLISAALIGLLGAGHLMLLYGGERLRPRDRSMIEAMQAAELRITKQTTLWRAWMGFNASHSLGMLLFGLVYGYLALSTPALLIGPSFLTVLGLVVLVSYVFLARSYWFISPLVGTTLALLCYVAAVAASWG